MTTLALRAILILLSTLAVARAVEPTALREDSLREFTTQLMEAVVSGQESTVFELVAKSSALDQNDWKKYCSAMFASRSIVSARLGGTEGWEILGAQKAGGSLLKVMCLDKMKYGGIVWNIYYYRSKAGWYVASISADDAGKVLSGSPPTTDLLWGAGNGQTTVFP